MKVKKIFSTVLIFFLMVCAMSAYSGDNDFSKLRNPDLTKNWLKKENIYSYFKEITNIKKPASIYIDDRALKFNGNFGKTLEEIENFTVYWKE